MKSRGVGFTALATCLLGVACSSSGSLTESGAEPAPAAEGEEVINGPPLNLPISRNEVPSSGLCRVFVVDFGRIESSNDFGCNNIENSAPLGSYVMYRSRANRNDVLLCRMSDAFPGVVDGIDVYDFARLRLIRVILPQARRTADNTMTCAGHN